MKITKLTGRVLYGNIVKPKSFNAVSQKQEDDPRGDYRLTLVVDEKHPDYLNFKKDIEEKIAEIKSGEKYRKLIEGGIKVEFFVKDEKHKDKDGNIINGFRKITMKRNAINRNGETINIDIFNKYNQQYKLESDISYGSEVQAAFVIGDNFVAKDKPWYLTLYLLAVLVEKETTSSYGFTIKEEIREQNEEHNNNYTKEQPPTPPIEAYNEENLPF